MRLRMTALLILAVFAAVNQATCRAVAIKWMLPGAARSQEAVARFLAEARATAAPAGPRSRNPVAQLVRDGYLRSSVAFWVASFMGLLLVYGLNTWLPQIMRVAGYGLDAALAQLLVLNVGAIVGLLVAGRVADRIGLRTATVGWFVAGAVFLALLAVPLPGERLHVAVTLHAEGTSFSASLAGHRTDTGTLRSTSAALRGSALIRMHGIWLWLRRLPVRPRPTHAQLAVQPTRRSAASPADHPADHPADRTPEEGPRS